MLGKLQFGVYELDRDAMELRKDGVSIRLQEQPLRVLATLVERPGEIVTREELQQRIWGKDTFVDFEQSLNKAVNRVREALNDEAGRPKYVETVPRRGYRFIAPVTGLNATERPQLSVLAGSVSDAKSITDLTAAQSSISGKKRRSLAIALSAAVVLLAAISVWIWAHPEPGKITGRSLTRLTTNGTSFSPIISRDGRMFAYVAAIGDSEKQIWIQQVAGGQAIQITHEREGADAPAFSPDGSQIAYESHGRLYEVPALGGDARLIAGDGFAPVYTPDGLTLMFFRDMQGIARLWTVPRIGGTPVIFGPQLCIWTYLPSPNGKKVLARLLREEYIKDDSRRWWTISMPGGESAEVDAPAVPAGQTGAAIPLDWVSLNRSGQQWIIFARPDGASTNLYRIRVTSDGKVLSNAEQITSAPAVDFSAQASNDGRIVFSIGSASTNLWTIPIDTNHVQVTGERQPITDVEGVREENVSVSRDGKRAVFASEGRILLKELGTEAEVQLGVGDSPSISPDGSFVVYTVTEDERTSLYLAPAVGGAPRRICQDCALLGPKGFSPDGSRVLAQKFVQYPGLDRIELINIATGEAKEVLSLPDRSLWHPYYSWDGKWMTFKMQLDPPSMNADARHFRIYIAPVENFVPAGQSRWIELTSGDYADDKPQLSPDGNTLYFTSNRDHHNCFWALRLNAKTKQPEGAPFAIQHLHYQRSIGPDGGNPLLAMELSVAKDKIVTNIEDVHSDIWMTQWAPEN